MGNFATGTAKDQGDTAALSRLKVRLTNPSVLHDYCQGLANRVKRGETLSPIEEAFMATLLADRVSAMTIG